jgi:hypothetical protein
VEHTVNIATLADNQPNVRIRFQLTSDPGVVFGGWTIDDLRLTAANAGGGAILTSSGSTSVGQIFNVHANGSAGDLIYLALDGAISGTYYPGIGTMSVSYFSPAFFLLLTGQPIPAGGQLTLPLVVPPVIGATAYFQGILVPAVNPAEFVISNVLPVTITP